MVAPNPMMSPSPTVPWHGAAKPVGAACTLCGARQGRLVRKSVSHDQALESRLFVCGSCRRSWYEITSR